MLRIQKILVFCLSVFSVSILFSQETFSKNEIKKMEEIALIKSELSIFDKITDKNDFRYIEYPIEVYQLYSLNLDQLALLRNYIFARHGYNFSNLELKKYFGKELWYKPVDKNVESQFSENEKYNIDLIRKIEAGRKQKKENTISELSIIGMWHVMPMVASGYSERYFIFANHDCKFINNEMDGGKRLLAFYGKWELENNTLLIIIEREDYLVGGDIIKPYASYGSKYVIDQGIKKTIKFDKPIKLSIFLNSYKENDNSEGKIKHSLPSMQIGIDKYWKMYSDPNSVSD